MTFKESVTLEIKSFHIQNDCCKRAFLSAVVKSYGTVEIEKNSRYLKITTGDLQVAEKVAFLVKQLYLSEVEIEKSKVKGGVKSGEDVYFVKLPQGLTLDVLTECGLMQADGDSFSSFVRGISPELVKNTCCAKAYLKGLFLTAGSIYVPQTTEGSHGGYHVEFQVADEKEAEDIKALLERFGLNFKVAQRGVNYIVYAKDKDVLLSFLATLSLTDAALELKKIIADRELNNSINRGVICEAANLDKTFEAAAKQILTIQKIEEESGLDSLGEPLKEVALSRLNNPTASMSELAELIGISKSCLAHRLRKIMKIGEDD